MNWHKAATGKLLCLLGFSFSATAATVGLSDPSAMVANDSVGWQQLGAAIVTLPGTITATTASGMGVTVTSSEFQRVDEGYGWTSNFTLNDQLLWNMDSGTAVTFVFATPIRGAGAYIQGDTFGKFSGTVTAYFGATKLGSFTVSGSNDASQDGSAPFLGIMSDSANITMLVFTEQSAAGGANEFALDTLEIAAAVTTPEPATLTLGTLALVLLAKGLKKKRTHTA